MTDIETAAQPALDAPASPEVPSCPVPLAALPPAMQKSLDPKSPLPLRGMAAKGLVPGSPRDVLTALFMLTFDPEPKVAEQARVTASKANDRIHSSLRDDELHPAVLAFYARMLTGQDVYVEFIALNQATPDDAVAEIAAAASERVCEVVSQNQLRILRDERIVRALVLNPNARAATKDSVLDFCVRSGVVIRDLPEYLAARRRVLGEDPKALEELVAAEENTVEKVIEEFGSVITDESAPPPEEDRRLTFTQRVMKMSVSQKIKLATLGNKEARTMLLRDSNKLVALAAVQSPRLTDGEVVMLSKNRTLHEDVMRYITANREWVKSYTIKVNLVNNPKCPVGIALKFLPHLHASELKEVARNKNIASTLQTTARQMLAKKESGGK